MSFLSFSSFLSDVYTYLYANHVYCYIVCGYYAYLYTSGPLLKVSIWLFIVIFKTFWQFNTYMQCIMIRLAPLSPVIPLSFLPSHLFPQWLLHWRKPHPLLQQAKKALGLVGTFFTVEGPGLCQYPVLGVFMIAKALLYLGSSLPWYSSPPSSFSVLLPPLPWCPWTF